MINIQNLLEIVQYKIENSTDADDVVVYSKILQKLNTLIVKSAETIDDLPSSTATQGSLYYVESENAFYYYSSNTSSWVDLSS
jgi:hypothetical protein